jgi:hypothetical protein
MKQVDVNCLLTRTICFDDNVSDEDIKKSIILPTEALYKAHNLLKRMNVKPPELDLKDWDVKDINYEIRK